MASYVWNARNQLASRGSTNYAYDAYGRRSINSTGTGFVYEGINAAQELSTGTPIANRILGQVDEFFSRTDSTGSFSPITDAQGSVLALSDSTGNLATQYAYDPFGNTTITGTTSTNAFQYTGRENDQNGLYFYRARYYNPSLQRFISEDPSGFGGGDVNLYAYVWNSPTNFFDPTGLWGYPVHVRMTNSACKAAGLSACSGMAQQVAAVDFRDGSQGTDADATNTHAMAGRKPNGNTQNCQQAFQGTQQQLIEDVNSGDLTKALHTIQDAYSPSHSPFRPWDGGYTPLHIPSPGHIYGDFAFSSAQDTAIAASAQFLRDIMQKPNGPINPQSYLPLNPCGQ